jgi:acetylornithine deacetylase/succinyl-diaminopimelate desuccinylase-like protein
VLMLIGFAALIDIALSGAAPGANANASGVAAALATLDALRREPPAHLDVHLLLAGAGEAGALGARAFLSDRRRTSGWRREEVALVALEPCGVGTPRYFTHEGALIAARLHPRLVAHAQAVADTERHLAARPYRSHGTGAARAARRLRWPSVALGALDARDRPGPARQPEDVPEVVQGDALAASLEFTLAFIARLDAGLGSGMRRVDGSVPA